MKLTNKAYDVLKWVVTVVLPAFGALYFGLGTIWGLPNIEQVLGSTAVLATFIGTLIGLSTAQYNSSGREYDGEFDVVEDPGGMRNVHMSLNGDPETMLLEKDKLVFRVVKQGAE